MVEAEELSINVEKDMTNKLLKRREIYCTVSYEGATPSRKALKNAIVHKLALDPNTVVIVKIDQAYGSKASKVVVHAYADKDSVKLARNYLIERESGKKKAKEGQQAQQAQAEGAGKSEGQS